MIKHPRSYEVSIWTLQDSFITVLKSSNLENKEQIQEGLLTLKDDGENTLSFSIPMYVNRNGIAMENPIWYNTRNGVISASMRKIKVIFNKKMPEEKVFEFIITKITESHEGKKKTCEIECEGLAFHELGRQGYKIELSSDVYNAEYMEWQETYSKNPTEANKKLEPINNINYWCDKVFGNSNWTYSICMDWSFEDGIVDVNNSYINMTPAQRDEVNAAREAQGLRRRDKVYKDPYISNWALDETTNTLIPVEKVESEEKLAFVDEKESNRYNLIQAIAEAFQVFAKFIYKYDDNYHIIGREVIFYNNFIYEANGTVDFTYAYNTQSLSREMDGTDLVTKMFVQPLEDSGTLTGTIDITSTSANQSREEYLINLDYMYNIGTITQEQYDELNEYNRTLHEKNIELMILEKELTPLRVKLPEQQAIYQTAVDALQQDQELLNGSHELVNSLTDQTGMVTIDQTAPHTFLAAPNGRNSTEYYFRVGVSGILPNTLRLYKTYDSLSHSCSDEITTYQLEFDEELGVDLTRVYGIPSSIFENSTTTVYATFQYEPDLVYKKKEKIYEARVGKDIETRDAAKEKVDEITALIAEKEARYATLAAEKKEIIDRFERFLGPALREGTWQPEDEYSDYQAHSHTTLNLNRPYNTNNQLNVLWDTELFEDEQKNFYYVGAQMEKTYYPCINLNSSSTLLSKLMDETFRKSFCLSYKDIRYADPSNARAYKYLSIGTTTGCQLGFVKSNNGNSIIPVLIIVGAESMDDYDVLNGEGTVIETYTILQQLQNECKIGILEFNENGSYSLTDEVTISSSMWLANPENYVSVMPRFEINSEDFIQDDINDILYREGKKLEVNYDYYVLYRDDKWYINLKPETVFAAGNMWDTANYLVNYTITTAALAIYLDAIQVLKENSTPKVSYTIEPLALNQDFMHNAYDRLGQLARINDEELKFENTRGYVSEVELNLDMPWTDKYTIKNYKTKFEDLFSMIVAQTAQMKKNSMLNALSANLFTPTGALNEELVNQALSNSSTLQEIINGNALIAANKLTAAAASNKAILANTTAYKIMNGDIGLVFPASNVIDDIQLNRDVGLYIEGHNEAYGGHTYFRVNNENMGFFRKDSEGDIPLLYFDNGDLALSGNIYAKNGWFGGEEGWVIGAGELTDDAKYYDPSNGGSWKQLNSLGGLLYSANGRVIFAAGKEDQRPMFAFYSHSILGGDQSTEPILVYDGNDLSLTGKIVATGGSIGGWHIGDDYIGNANTLNYSTIGLRYIAPGAGENNKVFWAGDYFNRTIDGVVHNAPPFFVTNNGKLHATNAEITGTIVATSFILQENGVDHAIDYNTIITGGTSITSTVVEYVSSNQGTTAPSSGWSTTIPTVSAGNYLWTRTTINYSSGTPSISYTVSKQGENGVYTTKIETLYYLKTSSPDTAPSIPSQSSLPITSTSSEAGGWRIVVPDYPSDSTTGVYYYCQQYTWSNNTYSTNGTAYRDYGLTTANQTATVASTTAAAAAGAVGAFTSSGLQSNYTWNGVTYNVALTAVGSGSSALTAGMLIGASGGITIVDVNDANGSAIALTHGGIGLHGSSINLTTSNDHNTNVISLSSSGIALASTANISLNGGEVDLTGGSISLTSGGEISLSGATAELLINDDGIKADSLVVLDNFNAPGYRQYYTEADYTIYTYTDLLMVKALLEKYSYGTFGIIFDQNYSGENSIFEVNYIQVGSLNISTNGDIYIPPMKFYGGNAHIYFSQCAFSMPSSGNTSSPNCAVTLYGSGLTAYFMNSWIQFADIGIDLSGGAVIYWQRSSILSSSSVGTCTQAFCRMQDGGVGTINGILPNSEYNSTQHDLIYNNDNVIWQYIGTASNSTAAASADRPYQPVKLTTYNYKSKIGNDKAFISNLFINNTTSPKTDVDLQIGMHHTKSYVSYLNCANIKSNHSTINHAYLTLNSNSYGLIITSGPSDYTHFYIQYMNQNDEIISTDEIEVTGFGKDTMKTIEVTTLFNKANFKGLVLTTKETSLIANRSYSRSYRYFLLDQVAITIG